MDQKRNPPYWVGVFGLIPLLGAFAGIIMIFLGAITYKNRILIWMGVAAILFTVAIYSSLIFISTHGKIGREFKSSGAVFVVDNAVMNIEMYRITHGVYPDSLQQLQGKHYSTAVYDPYQSSVHNLQYHRTGDHYTIFSVGADHIAGTHDDIYPDYFIADTTRSGLIKAAWADTITRADSAPR